MSDSPKSTATIPSQSNIRVCARIRPLAKYELENGSKQIVDSLPTFSKSSAAPITGPTVEPEVLEVKPPNAQKRWFELDAVFDGKSTQRDVYIKSGAQQAVKNDIFKGFNCTILAYGQTGSGKTFSMGTAAGSMEIKETDGIIPRATADLFKMIKAKCDGNAQVDVSYLEIYNEEIRDLMVDKGDAEELRIRETLNGDVYVSGLKTKQVANPGEVGKFMEMASKRRVVGSTKMNAVSSRSHAICALHVKGVLEDSTKFQAKLTLVDLAGSERIKKTGAQGNRRQEGININKGLFVLGQVVSALAEQRPKYKRKPPYRDSKLTRLLQDALGGNSRTIMLACVSPADFNIDETINTLRYATSARNIKNSATRNVIKTLSPEEAAQLMRENELLKAQVKELQETIRKMAGNSDSSLALPAMVESDDEEEAVETKQGEAKRIKDLESQITELKAALTKSRKAKAQNVKDKGKKGEGGKQSGSSKSLSSESSEEDEDVYANYDEMDFNDEESKDEQSVGETSKVLYLKKEIKRLRAALRKKNIDPPEIASRGATVVPESPRSPRKQGESISQSMANNAILVPKLNKKIATLEQELKIKEELEEENVSLREELAEVKSDAQSSRLAANKMSRIMDQLRELKGDEIDKKRMEHDHIKVEEAWVSFVFQVLETNKEQMQKLRDDFYLVARVVESPDVLIPAKSSSKWWQRLANKDDEDGPLEMTVDPEMRQQLLSEHIQFFNEKLLEVENDINSESNSLGSIRDSLRQQRDRLESEIGTHMFEMDTLDKDDNDLLEQLTALLVGPVKSLD